MQGQPLTLVTLAGSAGLQIGVSYISMIRQAQPSDAPEIARIHVASWQAAYKSLLPESFLSQLDIRQKEAIWKNVIGNEPASLLVATSGHAVNGFCHFTRARHHPAEQAAEITSIYLDPANYRQGIGTALVKSVIEETTRQNFTSITLWVLESNIPARRFYEKLGFSPEGSAKTENGPGFQLEELLYQKPLP